MKRFKVLILCICTVIAVAVLLTACRPGAAAADAQVWTQAKTASQQTAQAIGPASSQAAGGCCQ